MARLVLGLLALAAIPTSLAFRDTSPIFLFSTAELLVPGGDSGIARFEDVQNNIEAALKTCPTRSYVVVLQEGVSSEDFMGQSTPQLAHHLSGKDTAIRSTLVTPEVTMPTERWPIASYIERQCSGDGKDSPKILQRTFTTPRTSHRSADLAANDAKIGSLLADEAILDDYTVIYVTTPPTEEQARAALQESYSYDMEDAFSNAAPMELKRDLSAQPRASSNNQGGLFEHYQYFTPGIFLGLFAAAPLFAIIFVGMRALTGLEVSYFAFSKEMGPAAQRKQ